MRPVLPYGAGSDGKVCGAASLRLWFLLGPAVPVRFSSCEWCSITFRLLWVAGFWYCISFRSVRISCGRLTRRRRRSSSMPVWNKLSVFCGQVSRYAGIHFWAAFTLPDSLSEYFRVSFFNACFYLLADALLLEGLVLALSVYWFRCCG